MISFLHPKDFDIETISTNCMLAVTNEQVDVWNNEIQKLNTENIKTLTSYDSFNEIDDPNGFFKKMITDEVMNKFNENGKPPHILNLKINDICILLRHVDNEKGLTSNTRVRIVNIYANSIIIQTLDPQNPITASLCRFIFYLKLPFKKSLKMERRQFPLRLAYSISMNKSQGQEFQKVGLDITVPSFAHGHLYVSLSRIRNYNNIKFFVNDTNLIDNIPITDNVVYEEIVNCFDNII
jgi:ATP-dependent DNA helicase PIF1